MAVLPHAEAASAPPDPMDMDALMASMGRELFHYARVLTGSEDAAEDALQDTLVALLEQRARRRAIESPRAWLFTVLRRKALAREREVRADALAGQFGAAVESDPANRLILEEAFRALDRPTQEIVILHHWEGLTFAEIAKVLGVPRGTALSRYHRGIQELRKRFGVDALEDQGESGHEHPAAALPG